jgi:hypothetical protein
MKLRIVKNLDRFYCQRKNILGWWYLESDSGPVDFSNVNEAEEYINRYIKVLKEGNIFITVKEFVI